MRAGPTDVRAGPYAELGGRTWRCVSIHKPLVRPIEGDLAQLAYVGMGLPETPEVQRVQSDERLGVVPVEELSDVIEVIHEVPL